MSISKICLSITLTALAACSNTYTEPPAPLNQSTLPSIPKEEKLDSDLKGALKNITQYRGDAWIVNESHHDAFNVYFQQGNFSQAERHILSAINGGYELPIWDYAALAEINARKGNYSDAKRFIDHSIDLFIEADCTVDPAWRELQSALRENNIGKLHALFDHPDTPALMNTAADTPASHAGDTVYFFPNKGKAVNYYVPDKPDVTIEFPEEMPLSLVIDDKGKVKCVSVIKSDYSYRDMTIGLTRKKFSPATVSGKPVWQYGVQYLAKRSSKDMYYYSNFRPIGKIPQEPRDLAPVRVSSTPKSSSEN